MFVHCKVGDRDIVKRTWLFGGSLYLEIWIKLCYV